MSANGLATDYELSCNVIDTEASGQQVQNFEFTLRQQGVDMA